MYYSIFLTYTLNIFMYSLIEISICFHNIVVDFFFSLTTKAPIVNGIELDLYLFYTLVQQRGGLSKVCHIKHHHNLWVWKISTGEHNNHRYFEKVSVIVFFSIGPIYLIIFT